MLRGRRRRGLTKFAVVFQGRCGSAYLRMLLDSSPTIPFRGERLRESLKRMENAAEEQTATLRRFDRECEGRRERA